MADIPGTANFDSTLNLIRDPYRFISATARELNSDVFETRLLMNKTICMYGKEAAWLFVDEDLFVRKGAAPEFIRATLFGKGGIQGLDGVAHLHRKTLLMTFNTAEYIYHLRSILNDWLEIYSANWEGKKEISLYEEFQEILTRTVCTWAGIHLAEEEVKERTQQLSMMYDAAGSYRHLWSRRARHQAEKWICDIVKNIRDDKHIVPEGSPIDVITQFRDLDGELLKPRIAAVEILNLLRPTVAISLYFTFSVHALSLNPECLYRLRSEEIGYLDNFVNEVRRFYPFFPMLIAKVRNDFTWREFEFESGSRVLLDVYGTNHDSRDWHMPSEFIPDRFKFWNGNPFSFIPQGVGDHYIDHRCPGELITIELMRSMVEFFTNRIDYVVPVQDLSIDMSRLPAAPKSHMKISHVRRIHLYTEQFM